MFKLNLHVKQLKIKKQKKDVSFEIALYSKKHIIAAHLNVHCTSYSVHSTSICVDT